MRTHATKPAVVCHLTYRLEEEDIEAINSNYDFKALDDVLEIGLSYKYNNASNVHDFPVTDARFLDRIYETTLFTGAVAPREKIKTVRDLIKDLEGLEAPLDTEAE